MRTNIITDISLPLDLVWKYLAGHTFLLCGAVANISPSEKHLSVRENMHGPPCLNTNKSPYQYRDPMLKKRRSHERFIFSMESPYLGKTVFLLRRDSGLHEVNEAALIIAF